MPDVRVADEVDLTGRWVPVTACLKLPFQRVWLGFVLRVPFPSRSPNQYLHVVGVCEDLNCIYGAFQSISWDRPIQVIHHVKNPLTPVES